MLEAKNGTFLPPSQPDPFPCSDSQPGPDLGLSDHGRPISAKKTGWSLSRSRENGLRSRHFQARDSTPSRQLFPLFARARTKNAQPPMVMTQLSHWCAYKLDSASIRASQRSKERLLCFRARRRVTFRRAKWAPAPPPFAAPTVGFSRDGQNSRLARSDGTILTTPKRKRSPI